MSYSTNETDWILNILKINYKLERLHSVGAVYVLVKATFTALLCSFPSVGWIWGCCLFGLKIEMASCFCFLVMLIPQSCTEHVKGDWIQHLESLCQLKRLFWHINNTWDLGSANENLPMAHGMNFSIEMLSEEMLHSQKWGLTYSGCERKSFLEWNSRNRGWISIFWWFAVLISCTIMLGFHAKKHYLFCLLICWLLNSEWVD